MITGADGYVTAAYVITYCTLLGYGLTLAWRIARAKHGDFRGE